MKKNLRIHSAALSSWAAFLKPYKYKLLFVLTIFTISNVLLAVVPLLIGELIQSLSENRPSSESWLWVMALIASSSLHDLTWRGAEFSFRAYVNQLSFSYENHLFNSVISKPYPFFVDKLTGKIGSFITNLSRVLKSTLSEIMFDLSGSIVGIIATIFVLGTLNWQTVVIFCLGLIGMYIVGRKTLAYNMKYEAIASDESSSKDGIIFDAIANFPSVKAFSTELTEIRTIEKAQDKTFQANQKAFLTGIIFWGSMSVFVRHLIWPSVILLNVMFYMSGQLNIGQLATMLSTILIFSSTIWEGIWYISQFGQRLAHADKAHNYLFGDEPEESENTIHTKEQSTHDFKHTIRFNKLSFAYPDKPDVAVLNDISFTISAGEKIGIVGRSGSGKSTITKLLLDFYPIEKEMIHIDDIPIGNDGLKGLISFVPQDTSLFHRSIFDNIAYGKMNATKAEVETVAKLAHAHEFIKDLPNGYDTLVGERGVKLSGGQRQRIAIARAMLKDAPLLVLDEATSALDSESENLIQDALWKLMKDNTAIVIAHRLSTIQKMDRIIVLDRGKILEQGSHRELLKQKGVYADLWNHQSGGFIEE